MNDYCNGIEMKFKNSTDEVEKFICSRTGKRQKLILDKLKAAFKADRKGDYQTEFTNLVEALGVLKLYLDLEYFVTGDASDMEAGIEVWESQAEMFQAAAAEMKNFIQNSKAINAEFN